MEQVNLRQDYFAKTVFDCYIDWQTAFVRELFQNSVDAGSRNIILTSQDSDFSILDDGCGMDRRVLTECLLELLGTNKGEGEVGGKGRAKELLFFAWPEWSIRTGNLLVSGSFINYEIKECEDRIEGTRVDVRLDRKAELKKSFLEYTKKCSFSQNVTWNNEHVTGMGRLEDLTLVEEKKIILDDVQSKDPFITVKMYNNTGTEVYVRSNGLFMFSKSFRTDRGLIVEIPKGFSKRMLTGNRDNFLSFYGEQIDLALMVLSSTDKNGEVSLNRCLFNQNSNPDLDLALTLKRFANEYVSGIEYRVDLENPFYDNNVSGKDVLIELEKPQKEELEGRKFSYSYLIGTNARLENGEMRFAKVYFSEDPRMKLGFNLSDVVLSAEGSLKKYNPRPFYIFENWPYVGNLVIKGFRIEKE